MNQSRRTDETSAAFQFQRWVSREGEIAQRDRACCESRGLKTLSETGEKTSDARQSFRRSFRRSFRQRGPERVFQQAAGWRSLSCHRQRRAKSKLKISCIPATNVIA